jgi:hypothetical protein
VTRGSATWRPRHPCLPSSSSLPYSSLAPAFVRPARIHYRDYAWTMLRHGGKIAAPSLILTPGLERSPFSCLAPLGSEPSGSPPRPSSASPPSRASGANLHPGLGAIVAAHHTHGVACRPMSRALQAAPTTAHTPLASPRYRLPPVSHSPTIILPPNCACWGLRYLWW